MLIWQAGHRPLTTTSRAPPKRFHHKPETYGSLGHDELLAPEEGTVTTLKWLAAFSVLDNVGAATVPWSAELVAGGSSSSVSQRLGRALGDAEEPFEFCRDGKSSNGAVCCDALCDTCGEIGCKKQLLCTAAPAASAFGGSA